MGKKECVLSLAPRAGRFDDIILLFRPLLDSDQYSCSPAPENVPGCMPEQECAGGGGFNRRWEEMVPSRFSRASPSFQMKCRHFCLCFNPSQKCVSGENKALRKFMPSSLTHLRPWADPCLVRSSGPEKNPHGRHHFPGERWDSPTGSLWLGESQTSELETLSQRAWGSAARRVAQTWPHRWGTVYGPHHCSRERRSSWCAGKRIEFIRIRALPRPSRAGERSAVSLNYNGFRSSEKWQQFSHRQMRIISFFIEVYLTYKDLHKHMCVYAHISFTDSFPL